MQPLDISTAIATKTGDIGASFYFTPETVERGKALGLDGFRFYGLGRGGVLGDVDAAVVRSAFGYFHPSIIEKIWNSAKRVMAPRDAAREYLACAHEHGRRTFGSLDGLDAYVDAASTVIANVEGTSLALFAGVRAEPVPDDVAAAAMHQAMVLREMRGSAHLAAVTAVGLRTEIAHAIKRPNDIALFGWQDVPPEPTDADRAAHDGAESITDTIVLPGFAALSGEQAAALVAGTDAMYATL